eukprot:2405926-Pleurochrysis_carterae.AAC.1
MNYHIAKALAALRPEANSHFLPPPQTATGSLPIPVAVATPVHAEGSSQPPAQTHDQTPVAPAPHQPDHVPEQPRHFQRGSGTYPLRSSAFLVTRRHVPHDPATTGVRGHGCAVAASAVSSDPRT